jgi:dTDP-4-amino-4,6-dideoxygalactose transaminase
VLACSAFGTAPGVDVLDQWREICSEMQVRLMVDSAAGLGSWADDERRGSARGMAEIFSMHATKPFAVGEGGLIVTPDPEFAQDLWRLSNFGLIGPGRMGPTAGFNAKLSELQAATALAVLDRYEETLEARRQRASRLVARLEPLGCVFQKGSQNATWQFVPALLPNANSRQRILTDSSQGPIEFRRYYEPLHEFGALAGYPRADGLDVTEDLGRRMLSLPMSNHLSPAEEDQIVDFIAARLS